MFQQRVTVTYLDGTTAEATLDQYSISQFANFCASKGLKFDASNPGLMAVTMLRFQAWAQIHRGQTGATPSYTVWDQSVASVDAVEDPQPVDPTGPGNLGD